MFKTKKEKLTLAGIIALVILVSSVADNGLERLWNNWKPSKCEKKLDNMLGTMDSVASNVNTLVLDADTLKANADTLKKATREIKTMVEEDLELDRNTNEVVNGCTPPRCGGNNVVRSKKPVKRDTVPTVDTVPVRHVTPNVDTVPVRKNPRIVGFVITCCSSEQQR